MASISNRFGGVYLLHFDSPLAGHASHYIGFAYNVYARLGQHKAGTGACITRACNEQGIGYRIARVWRGMDRRFERLLKNRKNARALCPICNPGKAEQYPTYKCSRTEKIARDNMECPF